MLFLYMKGTNMKIENVDIEKIKPYENNPRNNDDAVPAIINSIEQFGWQQPIVVDKNNVIVAGHTRYKAALNMGLEEVPVKVADNLSDEKVKAYRLADNKTNEISDWNTKQLIDELDELEINSEIDMNDFGFELSPNFDEGSIDDQGDLTQQEQKTIECPNCGEIIKID